MPPSIGAIAACRRWLYGELVKFAGSPSELRHPAAVASASFCIGTKSKAAGLSERAQALEIAA